MLLEKLTLNRKSKKFLSFFMYWLSPSPLTWKHIVRVITGLEIWTTLFPVEVDTGL